MFRKLLLKTAAISMIPVLRKLLLKTAALTTSAPSRLVSRPRRSNTTPPISMPPTATRTITITITSTPTTTTTTTRTPPIMSMRTALAAQNIIPISSG